MTDTLRTCPVCRIPGTDAQCTGQACPNRPLSADTPAAPAATHWTSQRTSQEDWSRNMLAGGNVTARAMRGLLQRRAERGGTMMDLPPLFLGAIRELIMGFKAIGLGDERTSEEYLTAFVRGIWRGSDYPLNADGTRHYSAPPE